MEHTKVVDGDVTGSGMQHARQPKVTYLALEATRVHHCASALQQHVAALQIACMCAPQQ